MRDTYGIKLAAKIMDKFAEQPDKATLNRRVAMLSVRFPEYKQVFQQTKKLITGSD